MQFRTEIIERPATELAVKVISSKMVKGQYKYFKLLAQTDENTNVWFDVPAKNKTGEIGFMEGETYLIRGYVNITQTKEGYAKNTLKGIQIIKKLS